MAYSYRNYCTNITFDPQTFILSAQCQTPSGSLRTSSIDLNPCLTMNYSASEPGLLANNGSGSLRPMSDALALGEIKEVRLEEGGRFLRAQTMYTTTISDGLLNWIGADKNKKYWKLSEIDLDKHIRNMNGQLEFVAQLPKPIIDCDWIPKKLKEVMSDKFGEYCRELALGAGKGMPEGNEKAHELAQQLWGTEELLEGLQEREKKWWEGTYVLGGAVVRPGT